MWLPCQYAPTSQGQSESSTERHGQRDVQRRHLRRKSELVDDEMKAATAAYIVDEGTKPFAFEAGYIIDVATAIEMHSPAKKLLADKGTTADLRRTMMKTAVIMGFRWGDRRLIRSRTESC